MPWPIPAPGVISDRAAAVYESDLPDGPNGERPDARSETSVLGVNCRVIEMAVLGLHLQQQAAATEMWPDTARDNLDRLASIKGLSRIPATASACQASLSSAGGVTVPSGVLATSQRNLVYVTTSSVAVGSSATPVPWECTTSGAAGTPAVGDKITLVSPIAGLDAQQAVVLGTGLVPGEDAESNESLSDRLLQVWRTDAAAGNPGDWAKWTRAALPGVQYVRVLPRWGGIGRVGLAIAMEGPRAPTDGELAIIAAYLNRPDIRPVCAVPVPLAATLTAVPVALHLVPDTLAIRAAALAALAQFFLSDAVIAGTLAVSRLDAAVSSLSGEWEHVRSLPASDLVAGEAEMFVIGAVSFT